MRLSTLVRRSLADIANYLAASAGSTMVGETFVGELRRKCEKLAALPGTLGRPRPDLGEGIRSMSYRDYVIVFRYTPTTLDILDIVHAHRDVDAYPETDDPA